MNYTLHQLQVFLKITEVQSITKAAELLHLTQPAVSIQLKNLQDQFEIPLTEVIGRQLYVTEFGWEIAEIAKRILLEVEAINLKTNAFKGLITGKLKIAIVSTAKYVMPYFLSEFMAAHPGIELMIEVTNKSSVLESLEKNQVDFALVSLLPENMQVQSIPLLANKLFLVGNAKHAKSMAKSKGAAISEIPMIYRETGSGTRLVMEQFIKQNKLPIQRKLELSTNEAVKQAIIAGLGISIMPIIGLRHEILSGELSVIPYQGLPITTTWNLIWPQSKLESPAAKAYLSFLQDKKEELAELHFAWTNKAL